MIEKVARKALDHVRAVLASAVEPGTEEEVLSVFADIFGAEVDGWDERLQEIRDEEEEEEE